MPTSIMNAPSFGSRVRGLLHGVALGDALGAPVEKLTAAQIAERYGRVSSLDTRWHKMDLEPAARNFRVRGDGIVTDDTLMTICLMEVYNEERRHLDAWDMASGFVRQIAWTPRYVPELQRDAMLLERLFYPEKWIYQRHQLASCDPRQGGIGNMVNCGAAMYIAPIGVVNACDPKGAYDEAIAFASGHQESYGLEAAGVMAAAVAAAFIPGASIDSVVEAILPLAKDGTRNAIAEAVAVARSLRQTNAGHAEAVSALHAAMERYSPVGDDVNYTREKAGRATDAFRPSRLFSIEELPLAIGFCVLNNGEFRRTIEDGINSGRDTDSIGVMAGAILGALQGESAVGDEDRAKIDRINRLDLNAAADAFTRTVESILDSDRRASDEINRGRSRLLGVAA